MPRIILVALLVTVFLSGCAEQKMPGMKIGKPYAINGELYYPSYDSSYDRTGVASWYGPGFHGKYTASGEVYDQNDLTAAHPTLPMPSLVRVTNLENGKNLMVRVNDRGPFKKSRIIDLSKASAKKLGVHSLAKVRVQFLEQETQAYIAAVKANDGRVIRMSEYRPNITVEQLAKDEEVETAAAAVPAPVMTVASAPVETPKPVKKSRPVQLISDAMADEALDNEDNENTNNDPSDIDKIIEADEAAEAKEEAEMTAQIDTGTEEEISEQEDIVLPAPKKPTISDASAKKPVAFSKYAPASGKPPGNYSIQAGAFASEANANKLLYKLSPIAETSIEQITSGGRTLWRVRSGSFADTASAAEALQKIHAIVPDARIVHQ